MRQERVEEYLGAVYRLRVDAETPLPLAQLTEYFGFSPVSIHEMVQKLEEGRWVAYHPYRGVTLTETGTAAALALVRRHRLWERFLSDVLALPWDEAHEVAGDLEHAAPETVTERLAEFLGEPEACPHGAPIPPSEAPLSDRCLHSLGAGSQARVTRIAPETPELLRRIGQMALVPGARLRVVAQEPDGTCVALLGQDDRMATIASADAQAIWIELI
jgi:DtxR family Mn-dependent transcriptional regulator